MFSDTQKKIGQLATALLSDGYKIQARAYGLSMWPLIWPGMWVEISPCKLNEIAPNTIIAYKKDNRLILHYFVKKIERNGIEYALCKGLLTKKYDLPVASTQVLGKLTKSRVWGIVVLKR